MLKDFYGLAWFDFAFLDPDTTTLGRQLDSIAQGMGGLLAYPLGYEEAARLAFADAAANSGLAILEESNASSCEFGAYYGALRVSASAVSSAAILGVGETALAAAPKLFGKNALLNANRYLRIGVGRKGGEKVFRIAGDVVKKFMKSGHIDIFRIGKL